MAYKPHKEKEIENSIKEYIKEHGGLCYKIHGGDLYQETGIPGQSLHKFGLTWQRWNPDLH